jgi:hypothetical protein
MSAFRFMLASRLQVPVGLVMTLLILVLSEMNGSEVKLEI